MKKIYTSWGTCLPHSPALPSPSHHPHWWSCPPWYPRWGGVALCAPRPSSCSPSRRSTPLDLGMCSFALIRPRMPSVWWRSSARARAPPALVPAPVCTLLPLLPMLLLPPLPPCVFVPSRSLPLPPLLLLPPRIHAPCCSRR